MSVDNYVAVPREDWEGILNSVRSKTGKTALLKSGEVKPEIDGIKTGGDLPEEALVISGNCNYKFAHDGWNWFIEHFGSRITSKDVTDIGNMFYGAQKLTEIPFDINIRDNTAFSISNTFASCIKLTRIPKIRGGTLNSNALYGSFSNCQMLRELDPDTIIFDNRNTQWLAGYQMFSNCYSLRKIPEGFFGHERGVFTTLSAYSPYWYGTFSRCYSLDEIYLPLSEVLTTATLIQNSFNNSFAYCSRLKALDFATQDDGTAHTAKWKSQTIDLSQYVGYAQVQSHITNYNSGITADKCITANNINDPDAVNDPDAFTVQVEYSRYNHDSAVATINSLPDTSAYLATAGGTNTIKFKGASGSGTAGGAINTLTAEEIAVATAKGWTVTLV